MSTCGEAIGFGVIEAPDEDLAGVNEGMHDESYVLKGGESTLEESVGAEVGGEGLTSV